MAGRKERSEAIQRFLLEAILEGRAGFVAEAAAAFGITRQAIHRHLRKLTVEGAVKAEGQTRRKKYELAELKSGTFVTPLAGLEEHVVWRQMAAPKMPDLPENVLDIWHYGFTEMLNNAVDHSGGKEVAVRISVTALTTRMIVLDDGVGIFKKITKELDLEDERHAVLELSKGKLTTDPERHTGEGIFFSSRMFDYYAIISGDVHFSHEFGVEEDWIMEAKRKQEGTGVCMEIRNNCSRTAQDIFDKFTTADGEYGFTRTVVPVRLAKHGQEQLISRSQAKRLLARFERFQVVFLDFEGVDVIGQAFADEIFRVFKNSHPEVKISAMNAATPIRRMIRRALKANP